MNKFKSNLDTLEAQQSSFSNGGVLLRNIFSIYAIHPWLSLAFILVFGIKVNVLSELILYIFNESNKSNSILINQIILVILFIIFETAIFFRIKYLHKDLFTRIPLNQKKLLVTLVSKSRTNFKNTPSYITYQSLLYTDDGYANQNLLQKVVLITSEHEEVKDTAKSLQKFIEASGREAQIFNLSIDNNSILEIEQQISNLLINLKKDYKPHEIIADYTGGTKDMSISLFKSCEAKLILSIYLKDATAGNFSKYQT